MAVIFISYSHKDSAAAAKAQSELEALGHTVIIDTVMPAGEDFEKWIRDSIDISTTVLVLWSQHSANADWVRSEIDYANTKDYQIIPIALDNTPPDKNLIVKRRNVIDGRGKKNFNDAMKRVNAAVTGGQIRRRSSRSLSPVWLAWLLLGFIGVAVVVGGIMLRDNQPSPIIARTPTTTLQVTNALTSTIESPTSNPVVQITNTPIIISEVPTIPPTVPATVTLEASITDAFSLDTLNQWRVAQNAAPFTENAILTDLATLHLSTVQRLGLPELTADPTKAYINNGLTLQEQATIWGYTGQVVAFVDIGSESPNVTTIIEEFTQKVEATSLLTFTEIGIAQSFMNGPGKMYTVIIIGRQS